MYEQNLFWMNQSQQNLKKAKLYTRIHNHNQEHIECLNTALAKSQEEVSKLREENERLKSESKEVKRVLSNTRLHFLNHLWNK